MFSQEVECVFGLLTSTWTCHATRSWLPIEGLMEQSQPRPIYNWPAALIQHNSHHHMIDRADITTLQCTPTLLIGPAVWIFFQWKEFVIPDIEGMYLIMKNWRFYLCAVTILQCGHPPTPTSQWLSEPFYSRPQQKSLLPTCPSSTCPSFYHLIPTKTAEALLPSVCVLKCPLFLCVWWCGTLQQSIQLTNVSSWFGIRQVAHRV